MKSFVFLYFMGLALFEARSSKDFLRYVCNEQWSYILRGSNWECGCATGVRQSPINIPPKDSILMVQSSAEALIKFANVGGKGQQATLVHNGHAIQLDANLGRVVLPGSDAIYEAVQMHFHSPAEHEINDKRFEMELHVVCQLVSTGNARREELDYNLVLGFLFESRKGKRYTNAFLEKIGLDNLPSKKDSSRKLEKALNLAKLLGDDSFEPYYTYQGSLTTPPCTENVVFLIKESPIVISKEQIERIRGAIMEGIPEGAIAGTNRLPQYVNGRRVTYVSNEKY
mmetsp:Transcript_43689/g.50245  ORF Transcript_43689/g.50245 Transcript_43689/m.50245 type:complete len:284 (-) Transcript_43689:136-987(-)